MHKLPFILLICILNSVSLKAQDQLIVPYINDWTVSSVKQTALAEKHYAKLKAERKKAEELTQNNPVKRKVLFNKLIKKHAQLVNDIKIYEAENKNDRLKVRLWLFDVLGKFEYGETVQQTDQKFMFEAINIAKNLKDNQLLAEIYTLAARFKHNNSSGFLLYNLKAIELQRKVGFHNFSYVQNIFFNISYAFYHTDDFKKSISYGIEFLKNINPSYQNSDKQIYIFQLDIVGASYLKLKQYDSCRHYYQLLIDTLTKKPFNDAKYQNLWISIAKGNIGTTLIDQGDEKNGLKLVNEHLNAAKAFQSFSNIVIAQNVLAEIDYKHNRLAAALTRWRNALSNSAHLKFTEQKLSTLKGLTKTFAKLKQPDSVNFYNELYNVTYKNRIDIVNANKLNLLQATIDYDNLETSFQDTQHKLNKEILIRNFISITIILTMIISLLIYNHNRIKLLHKQQENERKIKAAKNQLDSFNTHILAKDKLIFELSNLLRGTEELTKNNDKTTKLLSSYVLITDKEWLKFKEIHIEAYPFFFINLKRASKNNMISPAEERLACLISLNFTETQMASMLGISADSVKRSKRRLKQKLNIAENQTLEQFIFSLAIKDVIR